MWDLYVGSMIFFFFPKGVSILLNEVSSSRSRNVGILVVVFAGISTEKSSINLKVTMGSLNNGYIKPDSLESTNKEPRVQLPDGENEVVQSWSHNSKGNKRPANFLLKSVGAGSTQYPSWVLTNLWTSTSSFLCCHRNISPLNSFACWSVT